MKLLVGVFGCSAEFETPSFWALVKGLVSAVSHVRVREIHQNSQHLEKRGSFADSLGNAEKAYAALPDEFRAKFTLDQWKRAGEGLARLLDAEAAASKGKSNG